MGLFSEPSKMQIIRRHRIPRDFVQPHEDVHGSGVVLLPVPGRYDIQRRVDRQGRAGPPEHDRRYRTRYHSGARRSLEDS
ncbi:hypothetical protein J6590_063189 [Homalodisca vitripennis]|nr:hypothetical protein J6590_063189 [Homalodisca vitripennis]